MEASTQSQNPIPEPPPIGNTDFGTMVVMPGMAGEAVLLGYANPDVYKSVLLNFNSKMMKAVELIGRDFCSLRLYYGLSRTISGMRQMLQDDGRSLGASYLAASLCAALLSRTADDISMMFTMTLPNVADGQDTAMPLSPMHIFTIYWMAQAVSQDLLSSVDGSDQSLFSEQRESLEASRDVMNMTKPIWDKFQGDRHPALHLISYREGLSMLREMENAIQAEKAVETAAA